MAKTKIDIGTRGSQLALWQSNWVKSELEEKHGLEVILHKIKTTGDKITDVPLAMVGGKGLFVKEIEEAMLAKTVDIAVHSMKDVPTYFPDGLALRCITERQDVRDAALIHNSHKVKSILDLPKGAKIGTSSLRRKSQLAVHRSDFEFFDLRGNLDTRIKKLEAGDFDAIILASAGLIRLGWEDKITEFIDPEIMIPAIGQGALGIESNIDDKETNDLIDFFNHRDTDIAVRGERALLKRLEGGCQVPIACYGTVDGDSVTLRGLVASVDGSKIIKGDISGHVDKTEDLGIELAEDLLDKGAFDILKELYDVTPHND